MTESDRIRQIFDAVVELAGDERAERLDTFCGGDDAVRRSVEELLAYDRDDDDSLAEVVDRAAGGLTGAT